MATKFNIKLRREMQSDGPQVTPVTTTSLAHRGYFTFLRDNLAGGGLAAALPLLGDGSFFNCYRPYEAPPRPLREGRGEGFAGKATRGARGLAQRQAVGSWN